MTITTLAVGAAVAPGVVKTYVSHYANRKPRRQKPTAHISYDEGLQLIRKFLDYASHKSVEDLQAFTTRGVPAPAWIRTEDITISVDHVTKAADAITAQLGPEGVGLIGGSKWWQWRRKGSDLRAEWIEMRSDYNELKRSNQRSKRVMLYVHGGAYFFGSVEEHRYQMQRHARKLKARVLAPRYRLAPQFPFPCGLQDCLATYLYLLSVHDRTEIILAGDSAGGGMVVSMLCLLRDRDLPLPAGAILISPWVDLTHSFPSVAQNSDFDYIPPHGFMQRPSASWPPPNEDEIDALTNPTKSRAAVPIPDGRSNEKEGKAPEQMAQQGFVELNLTKSGNIPLESGVRNADRAPRPDHQLSIKLDGKLIIVKDQIQMYTTNQLLSHPLVSPVLQPTLGGLPPMLVLTGGGELLRDEQIYLAHKAANPAKYPLGEPYKSQYDPDDELLHKYKATPVQLQVWEDLCHVAPTLSFTRPAKFMYRSIAQFGAWVLARAQKTEIEIADNDSISIISTSSESESDNGESTDSLAQQKRDQKQRRLPIIGSIGRAGDSLPPFKGHMIRQRVDRHGIIFPLDPAQDLPAMQMDVNQIGLIKPGPVRKWMQAKTEWDTKYASIKRKVHKQRLREMTSGQVLSFGEAELPPPSALAGRRTSKDMKERKNRKSYGLAMWSMLGSKHDEDALKREGDVSKQGQKGDATVQTQNETEPIEEANSSKPQLMREKSSTRPRRGSSARRKTDDRSRSRRRTVAVSDRGQTEGQESDTVLPISTSTAAPTSTPNPASSSNNINTNEPPKTADSEQNLTPMFIPKFKTAPHLRTESKDYSDGASTRTGKSSFVSPDNASTIAVFSAPGISQDRSTKLTEQPKSSGEESQTPLPTETDATSDADSAKTPKHHGLDGSDTPQSRRSIERLQTDRNVHPDHEGVEGADLKAKLDPLRSPSNVAVVRAEGVVGVVDGEEKEIRPGMDDRSHAEIKTANDAV